MFANLDKVQDSVSFKQGQKMFDVYMGNFKGFKDYYYIDRSDYCLGYSLFPTSTPTTPLPCVDIFPKFLQQSHFLLSWGT